MKILIMKYWVAIPIFISSMIACNTEQSILLVESSEELNDAFQHAQPGEEIVMANGIWEDVQIRFIGIGTENKPIVLRAETPGQVFIEGNSDLKFGGEYLIVKGLYFKNGYTPSNSVIEFSINQDTLANHCRVTECVIEDFNQLQRNHSDVWVRFWGKHNQFDHNYLVGKSNRGPTMRVDIQGNESIKNHHQITHNHFGPRPPKGGPSAETIQLGVSSTSMSPSNTLVTNNLFDRCNGEVEVISSKSNNNEFRNNVFYKSECSLVTRHGNYCIIDGNIFIGDQDSEYIGGIRLIGTGHWVTNNYFYQLKGNDFRSPLAVMNGIPRSPLNRYIQVTDVVVAHNSWINCSSPWQFGIGSNVDQQDVLPASEIRSARPIRTLIANNLIFNEKGDNLPIVKHDKIDGIHFKNNVIDNQQLAFDEMEGLESTELELATLNEYLYVPKNDISHLEVFQGYEFENIQKDLFGNSRSLKNSVGAISRKTEIDPAIMDLQKYGPSWLNRLEQTVSSMKHIANTKDFESILAKTKHGDTIELESGSYQIDFSISVDKKITVASKSVNDPALLVYSGPRDTPAFEMHPNGELILNNVELAGNRDNYAFAPLKENMSSLYNLKVSDSEISNFQYVLKAYKYSFAEFITFKNTIIKNCLNGIELSAENDDRGDYNAENLVVNGSQFENISKNVIDYYRGGYDESTIGGNFVVTNSSFFNCGAKEENGVLLNTYGIINVDISNNTFENNRVELVALLWGAKNNTHKGNEIINSGKILVEENLKLKLMY